MRPIIKRLFDACDNLWSQLVKARDRKCVRCGNGYNLDPAHIFGRVRKSVRWLLEDGLTLCRECHDWGHHNEKAFRIFVEEYLGIERYTALKDKARAMVDISVDFLEKTKSELQAQKEKILSELEKTI